jgi:outer membrane protein
MLLAVVLFPGCLSCLRSPPPPYSPNQDLAARVLIPPDLNVNPTETVVKPEQGRSSPGPPPPRPGEAGSGRFSLADALAFARVYNPRLRSARAAVERLVGQEQAAFAAFLPEIDLLSQTGITVPNQGPGAPGPTGFILPSGTGSHSYAQVETQLQWMLCDFGRTSGRYRQATARETISRLQFARAEQTVDFDVTVAYLNILLARASRRVAEDAIRRAEAVLHDARVRRKAGTADRDVVLRAEVQLSEIRETLLDARQAELDAVAHLNNTLGRNTAWPLEVLDLELLPPPPPGLAVCLERAAEQRPEVAWARQAVAAASAGRDAAQAEFLPRIYARASLGRVDGINVQTGWQEGAGLHIDIPLFTGGRHSGELRSADAEVATAVATTQTILDSISLEVNLAHRGVVTARERIGLTRIAVEQANENLRLMRVKYRNGNATPTDIVDAETTLTRTQQRYHRSGYALLAALARLNYVMGFSQGVFFGKPGQPATCPPGVLQSH